MPRDASLSAKLRESSFSFRMKACVKRDSEVSLVLYCTIQYSARPVQDCAGRCRHKTSNRSEVVGSWREALLGRTLRRTRRQGVSRGRAVIQPHYCDSEIASDVNFQTSPRGVFLSSSALVPRRLAFPCPPRPPEILAHRMPAKEIVCSNTLAAAGTQNQIIICQDGGGGHTCRAAYRSASCERAARDWSARANAGD
jgi:hypothetical protein